MSSCTTQPSQSDPGAAQAGENRTGEGDDARAGEAAPVSKSESALQNIIATFLKQNPNLSSNIAFAIRSVFNQKNHSSSRLKQTSTHSKAPPKPKKSSKSVKKKKKEGEGEGAASAKVAQKQKVVKPVKIKEPKSKSMYEKRQTIIINSAEVKRVLTPNDVEVGNIEETEEKIVLPKNYDLIEQHKRLEVCENRIINGVNNKYGHPAFSVKAAEEEENLNLNEAELQKAERYQCLETPQKIPDFWPERVWDRPDDVLSREDSEKMKKLIVSSREVLELSRKIQRSKSTTSLPKNSFSRSNSAQKIKQNNKKNFVIQLSMTDFETDHSSEETDF